MISQTDVRTFYELQPIVPLSQGWQVAVFTVSILAILSFVVWMCVRDSRNLPRGFTVLISSLRIVALVCILLYVLNPGKRSETRIVKKSRLAVVVDTSLSMGLRDQQPAATGVVANEGPRRIDEIIDWVSNSPEIDALREDHELTIYRFGDQSQPTALATLSKTGTAATVSTQSMIDLSTDRLRSSLRSSRQRGWLALAVFVIVIVLAIGLIFGRLTGNPPELQAALLCAVVLGGLSAGGCPPEQFRCLKTIY